MLGKIGDLHHRMQYIFGGFPEDFDCVFGVMFHGLDVNALTEEDIPQIEKFFKMNGRERIFYLVDGYINGIFNSYTFERLFHVK